MPGGYLRSRYHSSRGVMHDTRKRCREILTKDNTVSKSDQSNPPCDQHCQRVKNFSSLACHFFPLSFSCDRWSPKRGTQRPRQENAALFSAVARPISLPLDSRGGWN